MNFCENVTSCTADECTDFLCFDSTTGILTANAPEDGWANFGVGAAYCIIRLAQLWLGSLYWQKERELLSVNKTKRSKSTIKTQMMIQFIRSLLSTIGFYLLIQQSLYLFIALIILDTVFVPCRMCLMKKDNTHPIQDVLVELWHLYDTAHDKMGHDDIMKKLDVLIAEMKKERNGELPVVMANDKRRSYLSF